MPGHEQQPRQQGGPVNASPGKPRLPYRPDDLEILDAFALQIDTSSSDSESAAPSKQSRPSRPSHGRSLSHPFPSLFGTWKKKHDHPPGPGEADSDSSGDEMGMPRPEGSSSRSRDDRRPSATEYMSGSCMTCGTLLRWPKHLSMFKCTVCVTINDVRPVVEPWRPDGPSRANAAPQPHSTFPQGPSRLRGPSVDQGPSLSTGTLR